MKGMVMYKSKYGSTRQFAQWVAEAAGFSLYPISEAPQELDTFDVVVFAGSIHAGSVSITKYVVDSWPSIKDKKVIIMLASGASNREVIRKVVADSFPDEILNAVTVFPVGGRYVFNRMSFIDRNIIKLVACLSKRKEIKEGMLTEKDDVKRENLKEILDYLNPW